MDDDVSRSATGCLPVPMRLQPHSKGGRHPAAFHRRARRLIEDYQLLERLAHIAAGLVGEIHFQYGPETQQVLEVCEIPLREQAKAMELLGKFAQIDRPDPEDAA